MFAINLREKMPDPCNAKEYCQSKVITHQPKWFENPKILDIKSVIIEHPNTSHNLSKIVKLKNFPK